MTTGMPLLKFGLYPKTPPNVCILSVICCMAYLVVWHAIYIELGIGKGAF